MVKASPPPLCRVADAAVGFVPDTRAIAARVPRANTYIAGGESRGGSVLSPRDSSSARSAPSRPPALVAPLARGHRDAGAVRVEGYHSGRNARQREARAVSTPSQAEAGSRPRKRR